MTENLENTPSGLSDREVAESRKNFGSNAENKKDFTAVKLILKTLVSVFNIVIAILIVLLMVIGQTSTAKFIGIVAAVNTLIELVQEIRARMIIKKISRMVEKKAKTVRSGREMEIPVKELVIGDIITLRSGDRVPVDGEVVSTQYAEFDESILTGESKYIVKKPREEIRAGSFLSAGSCFYKMTKLSRDSYIQTITQEIGKFGITEAPLQSQINQIIKALTFMTVFFIALIVAEGLIQESQKEEIIINSATLVTSLVPQGLVLITTISFALGAAKIAKNRAIVQKLSAIEAMANTQVVCMDKTGTLTQNRLEVKEVKII